MKKHKIM